MKKVKPYDRALPYPSVTPPPSLSLKKRAPPPLSTMGQTAPPLPNLITQQILLMIYNCTFVSNKKIRQDFLPNNFELLLLS